MDLPEKVVQSMPLQAKWTLLVQKGKAITVSILPISSSHHPISLLLLSAHHIFQDSSAAVSGKIQDTPQYYVNSLKVERSLETVRSLLVVLRSQPISWLKQFCDFGGVETMLEILSGLQMVTDKYFPFPSQFIFCFVNHGLVLMD